MPMQNPIEYDGHTIEEKWRRTLNFILSEKANEHTQEPE
jgi:hypothetical protein